MDPVKGLNIDAYDMDEILRVFGINGVSDEDLARAKKIKNMAHPDKARKGDAFFLFYVQAYSRVEAMHDHLGGGGYSNPKRGGRGRATKYSPADMDMDDDETTTRSMLMQFIDPAKLNHLTVQRQHDMAAQRDPEMLKRQYAQASRDHRQTISTGQFDTTYRASAIAPTGMYAGAALERADASVQDAVAEEDAMEHRFPAAGKSRQELMAQARFKHQQQQQPVQPPVQPSTINDASRHNEWFNALFEKHGMSTILSQTGYDDWLKSDEGILDIGDAGGSMEKANKLLDDYKRKHCSEALTEYQGVAPVMAHGSFGGDLVDFTCGRSTFGTDLRHAYTHTLIPTVSDEEMARRQEVTSAAQMKKLRDTMDITPMTEAESMQYLREQQAAADRDGMGRAFQLQRDAEVMDKKNRAVWASMKQLRY